MAKNNNSGRPGKQNKPKEDRNTTEPTDSRKKLDKDTSQSKASPELSDQERAEQEESLTRQEIGETEFRESGWVDIDMCEQPDPDEETGLQASFPVVGVGASAGGLEALESFVSGLPEKSGIAFVVITHTHPEHPTRIPELLQRKSPLEVVLIQDGMEIRPDTIYVQPSAQDAVIENGLLRLHKRTKKAEVHMPVDIFLTSLAEDRGEAAGCVILSGTGTDGTGGLRKIKEKSGVAAAQDKKSARHDGMPTSAVETGMVDYVLGPSEIAEQIVAYFKHPVSIRTDIREKGRPPEMLGLILSFLADRTDHDFSQYKKSTLIRRIERRMSVNRLRSMEDYFSFLQGNPEEIRALFQDLLIGVTNFFRDPEVFDYLRDDLLPDYLTKGNRDESFRAWAPGCATGEEAYSVAMVVREAMDNVDIQRPVQVFATDIDERAIEKARLGLYPENIGMDVSTERLQRFFIKEENHYRLKKEIRESVVFAEQNVLRDPPFMHLDMLTCRNLLIYLEPAAQNTLLPLFHYSLKTGGILLLGTSENIGRFAELFSPVHQKYSIYKKRDTKSPLQKQLHFPTGGKRMQHPSSEKGQPPTAPPRETPDFARVIEKNLLQYHTPPCVIVDGVGDIVYINGRTGRYLEHAQGRATLRVNELAREGLRYAISAAFRRAEKTREEAWEPEVRIKTDGNCVYVNLRVKPLDPELKDHFMILFEEIPEASVREEAPDTDAAKGAAGGLNAATRRIAELERELENLREDYRTTQEELETSNEELKSSNEEMYSSIEEFQSTNEELESSREELESLNEELSTVNSELQDKIAEIQEAYTKITEVLNSTGIAIVFLDNELRVKRFTVEARRLINLIDKDVGRPLEHLSHNLEFDGLIETVSGVLKDLRPFEDEVRTTDGHWYRMRIMVYRTRKNVIEGAVLTFINIDAQKKAQKRLEEYTDKAVSAAREFAESIVDTVRESLLVLDQNKRVLTANRRFYENFHISAENIEGRTLFELGEGQWDITELRGLLDEIVSKNKVFEDYYMEHHFENIGLKRMRLNARRLRDYKNDEDNILLAIEDMPDSD